MSESRIYLKFLRENLFILLGVPLLITSVAGYLLFKNPPIKHTYHTLVTMPHDDQNAPSRSLMVEEVVSLLRQQQTQQQLNVSKEVKLSIHKASPFTIAIESSAKTMHPELVSVTDDLISFSQRKYPFLEQSAGDAFGKVNYTFIYLLATAGVSILLAFILSLARHYIRYY